MRGIRIFENWEIWKLGYQENQLATGYPNFPIPKFPNKLVTFVIGIPTVYFSKNKIH